MLTFVTLEFITFEIHCLLLVLYNFGILFSTDHSGTKFTISCFHFWGGGRAFPLLLQFLLFQALIILKQNSIMSMFLLLPLLLLFCMVLNLKKSVETKFPKLLKLPLFQALLYLKQSILRSMFPLLPLLPLFCMVLT